MMIDVEFNNKNRKTHIKAFRAFLRKQPVAELVVVWAGYYNGSMSDAEMTAGVNGTWKNVPNVLVWMRYELDWLRCYLTARGEWEQTIAKAAAIKLGINGGTDG